MSKIKEIIKSSGLYIFANTHFSQEQVDCEVKDLAKKIKRWMFDLLPKKKHIRYKFRCDETIEKSSWNDCVEEIKREIRRG